ncbi:MAG TPA: response regulator transcription factor [Polaromonas sp.]|uniref:response regulator transcription factor n=1 Tax=Polaromonas sp. TaxID=1869339 RepID=UPI002D733684|nr:response regulator transcription factor [Polaromonas sp.]HYW57157.1 response regulator transcription factor [Polaromonas sp.]
MSFGSFATNTVPRQAPGVINIGIAEDFGVVRSGLVRLFSRHADTHVVGTATSGVEALQLVQTHEMDVLVLDIAMPDSGAVDVLGRIVAHSPHVKVVVFSGYPEQKYALPMIRLGARGFVDKASALETLVDAVREVAAGGTSFSPRVQALMAEAENHKVPTGDAGMTAREFQVFLRLANGETVTDIANTLHVSDVTVSTHRKQVLKKLNLTSNSHLTRYAIENRYID